MKLRNELLRLKLLEPHSLMAILRFLLISIPFSGRVWTGEKRIVYMRYLLALLLGVSVAIMVIGCDESDESPTNSVAGLDGATLMNLEDGQTLTFLQTDTITDTNLSVSVDTVHRNLTFVGSGADWVLNDRNVPVANLKLNDESITLNGHWRTDGGSPSLTYFAVPPVIMPRQLTSREWRGHIPRIDLGSGSQPYPFAFAHFGFYFTKKYVGRELIQLPAGSFNAYRFNVTLYHNSHDTIPAALVREYYYPNIGLVQLNFVGGPSNRTLSLIGAN